MRTYLHFLLNLFVNIDEVTCTRRVQKLSFTKCSQFGERQPKRCQECTRKSGNAKQRNVYQGARPGVYICMQGGFSVLFILLNFYLILIFDNLYFKNAVLQSNIVKYSLSYFSLLRSNKGCILTSCPVLAFVSLKNFYNV